MYVSLVYDTLQDALCQWDNVGLRMKEQGPSFHREGLEILSHLYATTVDARMRRTIPSSVPPTEHDAMAMYMAEAVSASLLEDLVAKEAMVIHWEGTSPETMSVYQYTMGCPYALHPLQMQSTMERLAQLKALAMERK